MKILIKSLLELVKLHQK